MARFVQLLLLALAVAPGPIRGIESCPEELEDGGTRIAETTFTKYVREGGDPDGLVFAIDTDVAYYELEDGSVVVLQCSESRLRAPH